MAATFYSQADQDIYASGNKFIPQEQYRLGPYTPPAIMGQNTNTGLASTNVAQPYKWPYPEGGGEGAGNISGTQQRSWSPNQNLGPTNITDYEAEADDVGSTWGGSLARLQDLYSKLPTPTNLLRRGWTGIQRWREKRDVRREQNLQEEIRAHNEAAGEKARVATVAQEIQQDIDRGGRGDRPDTGRNAPGGERGQSPTGGNVAGTPFAQGGRIGYREGDPVIPEDENEDIYELMRDQNIPMSEQVQADPFQMRIEELMGKGLSWEDAYDIAAYEFQDDFAEAPAESFSDQGLASLV